MLYIVIVLLAGLIISGLNLLLGMGVYDYSVGTVFLMVALGIFVAFIIDGLMALVMHFMPEKMFSPDAKIAQVGKRERNFYEKIHIRKWKDKIPELGGLGGFSKKKVEDASNPEYIKRFLVETRKGVWVHILSMVMGFCVVFINLKYALPIFLPIAIINLLINIPSTFILRYNYPKLMAGYKRLKMMSEREQKQEVEFEQKKAS